MIRRHSSAAYRVNCVGFIAGFPFMSGLPPELATPRRAAPRKEVPAGSVGIGGAQTGIYPRTSPGGWNLIGRTPLRLFDVQRDPPTILQAGDRVRFRQISREEFDAFSPMKVFVRSAGFLASVQDLGRTGHRQSGISIGGALDSHALRVANALVGNEDSAAGLEATLGTVRLRFEDQRVVAWCGGAFLRSDRRRESSARSRGPRREGRRACHGRAESRRASLAGHFWRDRCASRSRKPLYRSAGKFRRP